MPKGMPNIKVDPNITPERSYKDGNPVAVKSKKAVLIQNKQNRYTFVNEEQAKEMAKKGEAIIMRPSDHDYLHGTKAALGTGFDGFMPGEPIQLFGEIVHPQDIGKLDTKRLLSEAEALVKKTVDDAPDGIVKPSEEELQSFSGKKREGRFSR